MAQSVYELLCESSGLAEKLNKNQDFSSFLMLVYSHLLVIAMDNPGDPRDILCTVTVEMERLMKISIRYETKSDRLSTRPALEGKLFTKRNPSLVSLLQVNTSVRTLAQRTLEVLERWIAEKDYRKECGYENVLFENSTLWKNLVFTSEMVLKPEYDFDTIKRMGWDEPEQPTEEEKRIILP